MAEGRAAANTHATGVALRDVSAAVFHPSPSDHRAADLHQIANESNPEGAGATLFSKDIQKP